MVDYSRWETIKTDGDDADVFAAKLSSHNESLTKIASWLMEANLDMSGEQVTEMLRFITTQHRGRHPSNIPRAQEIIGFFKSRPPPQLLPLLRLLNHTRNLMGEHSPTETRSIARQVHAP